MRELGVVCHTCFCTFYTSEMNTHSYMPFLFFVSLVKLAVLIILYLNVRKLHLKLSSEQL